MSHSKVETQSVFGTLRSASCKSAEEYSPDYPDHVHEDLLTVLRTSKNDLEPDTVSFDQSMLGSNIELSNEGRSATRGEPISGSRLVVSQHGARSGKVIWKVRIDRCGLQKITSKGSHICTAALRCAAKDAHGVRIGVAQKGARLEWCAGFDAFSYGLDWEGNVWTKGSRLENCTVQGTRKHICFEAGDVVSVAMDLDAMVLRFAVNGIPLDGAYLIHEFDRNAEVHLAVSVLWPGEKVTFLSQEHHGCLVV
jgi:hypothetical protein